MRFSIRDLAWLTVVVAIASGWWLQYRQSVRIERELAVEREEKARMLEFSNELTARLRRVDKQFDRTPPVGYGAFSDPADSN